MHDAVAEPAGMTAGGAGSRGIPASRGSTIAALALFLLGLATRWAFSTWVQPPEDALYSDMAGYLTRAQLWIQGLADADRTWAVYPPGTHWWMGIALWWFGVESLSWLGPVQALTGALVVPIVMAITRRAVRAPAAPLVAGGLVAVWPPMVAFSGYVSSETPYMLLLSASAWLSIRMVETGRGALLAGAATALAYLVRPPVLLTLGLFGAWWLLRRSVLPKATLGVAFAFALPCALAVAGASLRFHELTGQWGLISENGAIVRFFAGTDYQRLETRDAEGNTTSWFSPPPMTALGLDRVFRFVGHPTDSDILDAELERHQGGRPFTYRLALLQRNIRLLAIDNENWPEHERAGDGFRALVHDVGGALAAFALLPLAVLGIGCLAVRRNTAIEILALHAFTAVAVAAVYLGEVRYRVPYDGFLAVLAVYGVLFVAGRAGDAQPQDRWVRVAVIASMASLALLLVLPWSAFGS